MYIFSLVRQREERTRKSDDLPIQVRSPQLSLGTVAEMKEMTADALKKPQLNDDKEPGVSGGGKQWILQHSWTLLKDLLLTILPITLSLDR